MSPLRDTSVPVQPWCFLQAIIEQIPTIEPSLNAFRHSITADAAEHRALTGANAPDAVVNVSARQRAPLQIINNHEHDTNGAFTQATMGRRVDDLLSAINLQPAQSAAAIMQLARGATSMPETVWQVLQGSLCVHIMHRWCMAPCGTYTDLCWLHLSCLNK
jgi:hypothetical protein